MPEYDLHSSSDEDFMQYIYTEIFSSLGYSLFYLSCLLVPGLSNGCIIALYKGASSVMQNYIKLNTYVSPPSILQESLKNSRRHKSPFKSHYYFLSNVLGLSRWFMTPALMEVFCFV